MSNEPAVLRPGPDRSPPRGAHPVRAVLFDTYGTVCDFYAPLRRVLERFAREKGLALDAGAMAIAWRSAYVVSTYRQAATGSAFRPLRDMQRENLVRLLAERTSAEVADDEIDALTDAWDRLDPWPDAVPGLARMKQAAIIAPLSNGNFADMVRLARHAGLAWDIVLGSSVARAYKPQPDTYLKSVEALRLAPPEVCMVAAHQADLAFAAGHGMQTAFVPRPQEFGGAIKPKDPEPGADHSAAAELHPERDWTFVADDFVDLAEQIARA